MMLFVPRALYENEIAVVLDEVRYNYGMLTRRGYIYGLIAIDQDAKIGFDTVNRKFFRV